MKKLYIRPAVVTVGMQDICSNGLNLASVQTQDGKSVDQFDVVEEDKSKTDYNWDQSSWGGN